MRLPAACERRAMLPPNPQLGADSRGEPHQGGTKHKGVVLADAPPRNGAWSGLASANATRHGAARDS
eukprot:14040082-Alexandrium_andersonii.AAC.1